MDTIEIEAELPVELAAKVVERAAALGRPSGWIVQPALDLWMARQEQNLATKTAEKPSDQA